MYKLEFTLKQHTPLIHFQHDQEGATIRATEVKPKLDQYLFEKLTGKLGFEARIEFHKRVFSDDEKWEQKKEWLIGRGIDLKPVYPSTTLRDIDLSHLAFNYKLSFHCFKNNIGEIQEILRQSGKEQTNYEGKIKVKTYPCFFGNNGNETIDEFKWFSWTETVDARFTVFDEGLITLINNYFVGFIHFNNFGTRKTKGFGSFSVLNEQGIPRRPKRSSRYFFDIEFPQNREHKIGELIKRYKQSGYGTISPATASYLLNNEYLFSQIDLLYRAMRSGINIPNRGATLCSNDSKFYLKSLLFFFFKEKFGIQWDKKSVKEHFYSNSPCLATQKAADKDPNSPINYNDIFPNNQKKLIRDLLGLSTEQSWMSYDKDKITKSSISKIDGKSVYNRYSSPIIFKPIRFANRFRVYIEYKTFPSELLNKEFDIMSTKNAHKNPLTLKFPSTFNIQEYLFFLFEEKDSKGNFCVDLEDYVNVDFQYDDDNCEFSRLTSIFDSIRENLKTNE